MSTDAPANKDNIAKVAGGAGILLPATLVGTVLLLVHDMMVNGSLSTEDYGLYATCKRVLQIGFLLCFLGLENAVIHFVAKARATGSRESAVRSWQVAQVWSLAFSGALAGLLVLFAHPIAGLFGQGAEAPEALPWALRVLAICLPLASIRMISTSASQGMLVMWPKAIILWVLWPALNIAGVLGFTVWGGRGLEGVLWAYDLSMFAGALLGIWSLYRVDSSIFSRQGNSEVDTRAIWAFAAPLWIYTLVNGIYAWIDQLLLAGMRGMEQAGIYAPVATLAPLFPIGLMALNGIFAPVISGLHARGEHAELQRLYKLVARWSLILGLPVCVGALVAPEMVISIWPEGRLEAAPALQIVALTMIFPTAVGSVNFMLIMSGNQKAVLWNGIPGIAVNLALAFWLIPELGVKGAAIANGGALIAISVIACIQVKVLLGMLPFSREMWKPFAASAPALGGGHYAAQLLEQPGGLTGVLGVGVVVAVLYTGSLIALGLSEEDRELLRRFRRRRS